MKKGKTQAATMSDLIRAVASTKAEMARKFGVSYQSMHKWCRIPDMINAGRAEQFDKHLKVPKGTTMDVIMGRHSLKSISELVEQLNPRVK